MRSAYGDATMVRHCIVQSGVPNFILFATVSAVVCRGDALIEMFFS